MKLFLSYNTLDRPFVKTIRDKLLAAGFSNPDELFFDTDSLIAGDDWVKKIGDALLNSDAFLCFISGNGIGKWQEKEAVNATSASTKSKIGYKIIPIIVAGSNGEIKRDLPWFLVNYQWVEFAGADDTHGFEKLLTGLRTSEDSRIVINPKNPYKGLNVFETADAPYFFGRTADINWALHKLNLHSTKYSSNFLAIVADSGVGKSSFVKAGLLSTLQNGRYEGSGSWKYITITPGKSPLNELSTSLERGKVIDNFSRFEEEFKKDEASNYLNSVVKICGQKLVLFVDQFEEVVTQCKNETERRLFLLNLAKATESGLLLVLITLRSDYYASFAEHPAFKEKLENNNYTLAGIDLDRQRTESAVQTIKDVIQKPAVLHGVKFEPELVDRLVEDTASVTGALPLLQLTLFKLWNSETIADGTISLSEYNKLSGSKGMEGIIETHADDVYKKVCPEGEGSEKSNLFRDLLLQLVELAEGNDDVRRTVEKSKLFSGLKVYAENKVENMINELSAQENRLLKVSKKSDGKIDVDIVHEVLIRKWSKLKGWINENRKALKEREKLEAAAIVFAKDKKEYYKGRKLRAAIHWRKVHKNLSSKFIDDFIVQSKQRVLSTWLFTGGFTLVAIAMFFVLKPFYDSWQLKKECKISQVFKTALNRYHSDSVEKLNSLSLIGTNLNNQLKYCNCFPNLDSLSLDGTFEMQKLLPLKVLQRLRFLVIKNNDSLTGKNLGTLKESPSLIGLSLEKNLNLTSLDSLGSLTNLAYLTLNSNTNLRNIDGLQGLKKLTNLFLRGSELKDLDALGKVENLVELNLIENDSLIDLSGLKELRHLSNLTWYRAYDGVNLNEIRGLNKLVNLRLNGFYLYDLNPLNELKSLKTLVIFGLLDSTKVFGLNELKKKGVEIFY